MWRTRLDDLTLTLTLILLEACGAYEFRQLVVLEVEVLEQLELADLLGQPRQPSWKVVSGAIVSSKSSHSK